MASDRGTSLAVAGLAVVAFFVSTIFLSPHGFDSLRPREADSGRQIQLEAHLWEDPLTALRRHLEKLKKLCFSEAPSVAPSVYVQRRSSPDCERAQGIDPATFRRKLDKGQVTLIVALLPGATLGGEEGRRRSRYALLSGLNVAGYVPDDSERMGLLRILLCPVFTGCQTRQTESARPKNLIASSEPSEPPKLATEIEPAREAIVDLPYETFTADPSKFHTSDGANNDRRVVVLWLDDSALGQRWLTTITNTLTILGPSDNVRLRLLGPATSDKLVEALGSDLGAMEEEARFVTASHQSMGFLENWRTLTRLQVISPSVTAPDAQLLRSARLSDMSQAAGCSASGQSVEMVFNQRLSQIREALKQGTEQTASGQELPRPRPQFFRRTIGTDDQLFKRLVDELFERGLDTRAAGVSRRIALIGEWDSLYARTFAESFKTWLPCESERRHRPVRIEISSYQYLRGLDGMTFDAAQEQGNSGGTKVRDLDNAPGLNLFASQRTSLPVEWPEGNNQRDYLRHLVQRVKDDADARNPEFGFEAIGIIGSDVHDKLLLMQALRDDFPDTNLFTTDLDARLLHPAVNQYTRNLFVASSLPLALSDIMQCGVSPFRDAYQTAMFLAVRQAVAVPTVEQGDDRGCPALNASELEDRIRSEIAYPYLFEVSRDGPVELVAANQIPRTSFGYREIVVRTKYAILFGVVVLLVGLLVTIVFPGPAIQAARRCWTSPAIEDKATLTYPSLSTVVVAGLEMAALGFAAGVAIELGMPGRIGLPGAILLAVAAATFFWIFVFPGGRWVRNFVSGAGASGKIYRTGRSLRMLAVAALYVAFVAAGVFVTPIVVPATIPASPTPFLLLSGISPWPSQLLGTLAIMLFPWFLDHTWCKSERDAERIRRRYFPIESDALTDGSLAASTQATPGIAISGNAKVWSWQSNEDLPEPDHPVDGAALWKNYQMRLRGWRRLKRNLIWFVLVAALILTVTTLAGSSPSAMPGRGFSDRILIAGTVSLNGLMVLILLVLVGDVTILTWHFISLLKGGRTVYPRSTVRRFAAQLGPELQNQAAQQIDALAAERNRVGGRNSLLDDWIDMRLISEHTAAIGPLIVFPFVLIGLVIVSRSRLFDNWHVSDVAVILFACLVAWSVGMAVLLNRGAEMARRISLERMEADALWLKGAGPGYAGLADQFPRLIDQVRDLRKGAFAPFFEQPLVQALVVPLGGAGGVQLLDYLILAR
jgi:hypothetical protein